MAKTKANGAIQVEKGVPIPRHGGGGAPKYPWAELEVGDSFVATGVKPASMQQQCCVRARVDGRKYTARTENGGVRVWRIA